MKNIQFNLFGTVVECWMQSDDGPRTSFDVAQLPDATATVIGEIIIAQQQELAAKTQALANANAEIAALQDQVTSLTEQLEAAQSPE